MADIYLREGSTIYQARLRVAGSLVRKSTACNSPEAAQQEADRLERELNDALVLDTDLRLSAATAKLFTHPGRKKPYSAATIRHYTLSFTNIMGVLGDEVLRLLDVDKVRHYIKTKLKTGKSVQLRRDLAFLSVLMSHAKAHWECGVEVNPVKLVERKHIHDANARTVYMLPRHYEKLLAACKTRQERLFVILAIHTGMRHQEIMKLHWDEVYLKESLIQLDGVRTKNSCTRQIGLTDIVKNTLSDTPETQRVGFVFKGEKEGEAQYNFAKRWAGIRKRAEMPNLRIHDLRHTFCSWLIQSGVDAVTAQHLMGHKTESMTKRYAHPSPKALVKAVQQMVTEHNL
ncbi:MAG: site-specific integrase [Mesorhizobium sp.]|nr:MAG: site-specific integrase [Mesorhizobium sp.]